MRLAAALSGVLLAMPAMAVAADAFAPLLGDKRVTAALQFLRADDARTLDEQIAIARIPAPTFDEGMRAQDFAARLRAAGLDDISIDAAGNVIGKRKGAGKGPLLVLSAHLDTVFARDTDLTVKVKDGRHYAPGIMDDARALTMARTLSPIEPRWTGMCGALAIRPPRLSNRAQEKSSRSLILTE